jgi:hypothetical protein
LSLDGEQTSGTWLLIFHLETPQKDNLASARRYTKIHPDPDQVPVYSDLEKLVTWRNIREGQISFFSGKLNPEISPSTIHQSVESIDLIDILKIHFLLQNFLQNH